MYNKNNINKKRAVMNLTTLPIGDTPIQGEMGFVESMILQIHCSVCKVTTFSLTVQHFYSLFCVNSQIKCTKFSPFMSWSGSRNFVLLAANWTEKTNSRGIIAKPTFNL